MHVRDLGMQASTDEEIFELARSDDRVLVSDDTDFGTLLALRSPAKPSVIIFRRTSGRCPSPRRNFSWIACRMHGNPWSGAVWKL